MIAKGGPGAWRTGRAGSGPVCGRIAPRVNTRPRPPRRRPRPTPRRSRRPRISRRTAASRASPPTSRNSPARTGSDDEGRAATPGPFSSRRDGRPRPPCAGAC
ncbi:hypothetical protein FV223_13340 [Methylobacterium sp. WL116]|nr:hypothetical protein FV223_13340 [Methylobacterium sp. WL116]